MTRWIEKSGTGIEKSGTGIEKSGTGIEKAGTGIEKSGTGIEKSGTGIRRALLACSLAATVFATGANANASNAAGELQVVHDNGILTASWSIDGSVFVGVGTTDGSYAAMNLTEVSVRIPSDSAEVVGNGTGIEVVGNGTGIEVVGNGTGIEVVGNGTGSKVEVVGNGTGIEVVGNGTGSKVEVVGNGTGSSVEVVGNGTGSSVEVVGNGTGIEVVGNGTGIEVVGNGTGIEVVGNGTGSRTLVVGNGTGMEAVAVTVNGDLSMEITMSCGFADVYVLDSSGFEVIAFNDVKVKGAASDCGGNWDHDEIVIEPGHVLQP